MNTMVCCLHCNQEYDGYKIHWIKVASWGAAGGYWACPTPGCDGRGFCFDIWPTDPEWRDEHGNKVWFDDEEDPESEDFGDGEDDEVDDESDEASDLPF